MKRSAVIILILCCLFTGCAKKNIYDVPELITPAGKSISETDVERRDLYKTTVINGEVLPETTEYAFSLGGRVAVVYFSVGDHVNPGDVLAELDDTNARAELSAVQDEYDEINDQFDFEIDKLKKENEAEGATWQSKELNDLMISQYEELRKEKLQSVGERLETAKNNLAKTKVTAVKEGYVTAVGAQAGRYIYTGSPVMAVSSEDEHYVICDYIDQDKLKNAVRVFTILGGVTADVRFLKNDDEDSPTHSYFTVDDTVIYSGDYAPVVIISDLHENVIAVPNECLYKDEGGRYVYLVSDNTRVKTYVTTGFEGLNHTEITEGLSDTDRIYIKEEAHGTSHSVDAKLGDFVITTKARARVNYMEQTSLNAVCYHGTLIFKGFNYSTFEMIKKGDVIATYEETVDEDYIAECKFALELAKLQEDAYSIAFYENLLQDIEECTGTREITAPYDGMIISMENVYNGSGIQSSGKVCTFASVDSLELTADNSNNAFRYGQTVVVEAAVNGKTQYGTAHVLTASQTGLTGGLSQKTALLKLDEGFEYLYFGSSLYASVNNVVVENVVLVNVDAVVQAGSTPVVLVSENGEVTKTCFVTGRKGNEYYWAADGIEPGAELVY